MSATPTHAITAFRPAALSPSTRGQSESRDFTLQKAGEFWKVKREHEKDDVLFKLPESIPLDYPGRRRAAYIKAAGIAFNACPIFIDRCLEPSGL